jgi:hypothetical protein
MCGPNSASGFGCVMALQEPVPDTQCQPWASRNSGQLPVQAVTSTEEMPLQGPAMDINGISFYCKQGTERRELGLTLPAPGSGLPAPQMAAPAPSPAACRCAPPNTCHEIQPCHRPEAQPAWLGISRDLRQSLNMQLTAHLSCPDQNFGSTNVLFSICAIAQALRSCTSKQALHLEHV